MRVVIPVLFLLLFTSQATAIVAPVEPKIASQCDENLEVKENVVNCIKEVFRTDSRLALAVAEAESHFDHDAKGYNKKRGVVWSTDCSIFQVNNYYHKNACEMTAKENILYAHELYLKYGWTQWSAYKNKSYLAYL